MGIPSSGLASVVKQKGDFMSNGFSAIKKKLFSRKILRAIISITTFLVLWEIGSRSQHWLGFRLPWIGSVPPPSAVMATWASLLSSLSYWQSWFLTFTRVLWGFLAAMVCGILFGLFLAVNRTAYGLFFPIFELLRPIPPLAWVPASIIFWPTQELSIAFVIFLGGFYAIVTNVLEGAKSIDARYLQSAQSMGASQWNIFRRIILPGTLPSIAVGSVVGIGLTWNVVVAAEMISGGGSNISGEGGGLGFFIWNSYVNGSYEQIVVGMISIGIAGYISSAVLRKIWELSTPWLRLH